MNYYVPLPKHDGIWLNNDARLMGSNWNYNRPEDAWLIGALVIAGVLFTLWLAAQYPARRGDE